MRWPLRRRPAGRLVVVGRPDYARIAVLEHELFGIAPAPGTVAAAMVGTAVLADAMRRAAVPGPAGCAHEEVASVRTFGDGVDIGLCVRCGIRVADA